MAASDISNSDRLIAAILRKKNLSFTEIILVKSHIISL